VWARIRTTHLHDRHEGLLDIGCGTGGFLAAAGGDFPQVLGIDIAFRWLVVAKKRLAELGLSHIVLVCACAEYLPFPDDGFDLVVAEDVLDHVRDRAAFLREGTRVLNPRGVFYLSTPNRYSAAPDPHVSVWGVGLLPTGLRDRYVQWRRGIPYGPIHPISFFELRRLLRASPAAVYDIAFPDPADLDRQGLSRLQRVQLRLYGLLRRIPVVSQLLNLVGPIFQVVLRKTG
jgi:SAM-dependent methyltransferase